MVAYVNVKCNLGVMPIPYGIFNIHIPIPYPIPILYFAHYGIDR